MQQLPIQRQTHTPEQTQPILLPFGLIALFLVALGRFFA